MSFRSFITLAIVIAVTVVFSLAFKVRQENNALKPQLIYVGDVMCSWCYGFSPEITAVKERFKDEVDFKLLNGGLRPYTKEPMDAEMKKFLRQHWKEVKKASGQPFSYNILADSSRFVYDTEPAARAVATVRKLKPGSEFEFFKKVQNSFYVENRNTSDINTYLELLPQFNINKESFKEIFNSEQMKQAVAEEFKHAEALGVSGFPAVLLNKDGQYIMIANGYSKRGEVIRAIEKALEKK
ncbi:MAG: DsbA family protein [Sporocytophaga sp.]|uniref:DsbA family protein n=1 Tax=Sporocytophaga sp. TaxID=2231183 RepID=UPI001B244E1D|nr:DsbA family protein [Sporocytophaga sp.]MBO9703773.1 DsbA family protein [Sporocytophaga sp.]